MAKKVLFLDDSKSILKTITFTVTELVESGVIEIQTYSDSEAFARHLQDGTIEFDIMFCDINMPVLSGYDVVKIARSIEKYKTKMIIALTTEISEESKKMGKEAGFNGWITKISSPEVMKSTISNTIRAINAKG
jgi:two-component system, chemotaxis family, chemotaxis protein CheY